MALRVPLILLLALGLTACGGDEEAGPGNGPATAGPDRSSPAGVVQAYLAAAKAKDKAAMLALGTEAWQAKESTGKRAFTRVIAEEDVRLTSHEMDDPQIEGDTAKVRVRAVFATPEDKEDNEGMRFTLTKTDTGWWITNLS